MSATPRGREERAAARAASALGEAAQRALPLVQERRGTVTQVTQTVARRLTAATIELCSAQGFDEVTVDAIAERAQVNRRTFFRYFPGKETVFLDILDQTNESLVRQIARQPGTDVLGVLEASIVAWCDEHDALLKGIRQVAVRSRSLNSAITLHASEWEVRVATAFVERFPDLSPDIADLAGILAMGSLRVARVRAEAAGTSLGRAVAEVLAATREICVVEVDGRDSRCQPHD